MEFQAIFEEAMKQDHKLWALREAILKLCTEGVDKHTIIDALVRFSGQMDTEEDEDIVLEATDYLYGWCSPDRRID